MTTLPRSNVPFVQDIHPKLSAELHHAIDERDKARTRGDWVTSQGWRLVIESLLRVQNGARP